MLTLASSDLLTQRLQACAVLMCGSGCRASAARSKQKQRKTAALAKAHLKCTEFKVYACKKEKQILLQAHETVEADSETLRASIVVRITLAVGTGSPGSKLAVLCQQAELPGLAVSTLGPCVPGPPWHQFFTPAAGEAAPNAHPSHLRVRLRALWSPCVRWQVRTECCHLQAVLRRVAAGAQSDGTFSFPTSW